MGNSLAQFRRELARRPHFISLVGLEERVVLDFSGPALAGFWEKAEQIRVGLRSGAGCYLFAVRAAKGFTPWYVGQSKGAFDTECFALHKQAIYKDVMDDRKSGTPVLFLIARTTPTGRLSKRVSPREANFVERRLIHDANNANPKLKNIHNAVLAKTLQIPGVLNSPKGRRSPAVAHLMKALTSSRPSRSRGG